MSKSNSLTYLKLKQPALVAQSSARATCDEEVAALFKKCSCQFLTKESAQLLVNCLDDLACLGEVVR